MWNPTWANMPYLQQILQYFLYCTFCYTQVCRDLTLSKQTIICDQHSNHINYDIGRDQHWFTRLFLRHKWRATFSEMFMPMKNLSVTHYLAPICFTHHPITLCCCFFNKNKNRTSLYCSFIKLIVSSSVHIFSNTKWFQTTNVNSTIRTLTTLSAFCIPLFVLSRLSSPTCTNLLTQTHHLGSSEHFSMGINFLAFVWMACTGTPFIRLKCDLDYFEIRYSAHTFHVKRITVTIQVAVLNQFSWNSEGWCDSTHGRILFLFFETIGLIEPLIRGKMCSQNWFFVFHSASMGFSEEKI